METLLFGVATRDITPDYPVWLHGYGDRKHPSTGISEPLSLSCLAVSDGVHRVLLFTADLVGIRAHICERLAALVADATEISPDNILISSSHTHFAPALQAVELGPSAFGQNPRGVPHPLGDLANRGDSGAPLALGLIEPDPRFVAAIEAKFVECACEALRELRPGRLQTVRCQVPQVVYNRRTVCPDNLVKTNVLYPNDPDQYRFSPTDTELTVLRVLGETGVRAVLANFGCHPVTGGQVREVAHYHISADYPFYLRQTVAAAFHCPVLFCLGTAGDAVPINRFGDCRQRVGTTLGHSIVLSERRYHTDKSCRLFIDRITVGAETILTTAADSAEHEYSTARAAFLALLADPQTQRDSEPFRLAGDKFDKATTAVSRARLYPANRFEIPVRFLGIGRTILVGLPFEVLSEFSLKMKSRYPDSVLLSCTGGYQGYLPFAYEYERGGYEATPGSTHFVPGTADRLLDATLAKLAELQSE